MYTTIDKLSRFVEIHRQATSCTKYLILIALLHTVVGWCIVVFTAIVSYFWRDVYTAFRFANFWRFNCCGIIHLVVESKPFAFCQRFASPTMGKSTQMNMTRKHCIFKIVDEKISRIQMQIHGNASAASEKHFRKFDSNINILFEWNDRKMMRKLTGFQNQMKYDLKFYFRSVHCYIDRTHVFFCAQWNSRYSVYNCISSNSQCQRIENGKIVSLHKWCQLN